MKHLKAALHWLRGIYDQHWLRGYVLWVTAWFAGIGLEHHGWESWLGIVSYVISLCLVTSVSSRLRKAKCTKLQAEIVQEQRSKAMWS